MAIRPGQGDGDLRESSPIPASESNKAPFAAHSESGGIPMDGVPPRRNTVWSEESIDDQYAGGKRELMEFWTERDCGEV